MEEMGVTLDALLKELVTTRDFDRFMRERGWTFIGPTPTQTENVRFDLPFIPSMVGSNDSQRCVS
jgi:hypothetical protein